ncbi:phospholipase A2 inhibitor and Ly6/PLAUR domain-containing protein isoform X2 [Phascolarctos cinereus]|uniref:Phospholipase A2 inhibitor and Ly6/PLAUR domain-containing protein isoform X2 n=1 Tax=Phascolarctos cinereus TaxID=38626 RepID=A0A6P5LQK7_PHACI|nr:phospholipase A2 inhibitor and Ly6/PLAUR domain-containing protein isoform X2 [Phascolarctos cinereus]
MRITRSPQLGLLALSLLCTLLSLAQSLTCEVCKHSGPSCTGKLKLCEAGKDACIIVVGLSTTVPGGIESVDTSKSCMKYKHCYSGFISTSLGLEEHMVSNSYCCQEDGCNKGSIPTPRNNSTRNGLRCPACKATFREYCSGKELVQCVGNETHCVYFAGTVYAGILRAKFAARGCASESACNAQVGGVVPSVTYTYELRRADCVPAPQPPGWAEKKLSVPVR